MIREHPHLVRRVVLIILAIIFFALVVAATVYSLTAYREQFTAVTVGMPSNSIVIKDALYVSPIDGGLYVNYLEQADGPWGKRYILRQLAVRAPIAVDASGKAIENQETAELDENGLIKDAAGYYVYGVRELEGPVVVTSDAEVLYDGMEVRVMGVEEKPISLGSN